MLKNNHFLLIGINLLMLTACSASRKINRQAGQMIYQNEVFKQAHVGIFLYDPQQKKVKYDYQGEKYFVPASNTKIITCYTAMKYLGEHLQGIRYLEDDTAIYLRATGDPTLLHPDFAQHPVADFIRGKTRPIYLIASNWKEEALGYGWSWDDYNDNYMAERSPLPVYGNVLRFHQVKTKKEQPGFPGDSIDTFIYTEPDITWEVNFSAPDPNGPFRVKRERDRNVFMVREGKEKEGLQEIPFVTNRFESALILLEDTLHRLIKLLPPDAKLPTEPFSVVESQPVDSFLRKMMYRSDNFYAEQALLMVSDHQLGFMNDQQLIDTLLKGSLKDFPQHPKWVDGSGLSRYNLFTPHDMVWVLEKIRQEFAWERIKTIFPAGGQGTIRNYFKSDVPYIYAKTGTLSGVVSLSGYLITRKNNTLLFSILVNNSRSSATDIRRQVEKFLVSVRESN